MSVSHFTVMHRYLEVETSLHSFLLEWIDDKGKGKAAYMEIVEGVIGIAFEEAA